MRIPASHTPHGTEPAAAAHVTTYSSFDDDEELALGCECANPALQIDSWVEETTTEPPCAAY
jgi:hypothetical protein